MERHIQFFEANETNCALSNGEKLLKRGIILRVVL